MRIFILASLPSSLSNFRGALIDRFIDAGHEVHAGAPGIREDDVTCAWLKRRGVRYYDIPLSRTGLSITNDLRALIALRRQLRKISPDLVLAYTIKPVIWGMIAAWLARVPKRVALITGLGYAYVGKAQGKRAVIRWLVSKLYRIALTRASLVFFQNPDDRDDFRRWGILSREINAVVVSGSGVDTMAFSSAPIRKGPPLKFLLIARLLRDKGVREYVEAARIIRKNFPEAECHLIGPIDSNPSAICEAEIRAWENAGLVIWHGAQSDVRPYIAAAHVYVFPSYYREGTPRSVLEAMSMGRPIITTDAPGCRETVEDGVNGFLVPVKEAVYLAQAMERFLEAPNLVNQLGAQSRRIAVEKYDVHKVNAFMIKAMGL